MRELSDKCGVFGVYGNNDAAKLTYWGLYMLQHRGHESAGIATYDADRLYYRKGTGEVTAAVPYDKLYRLKGDIALGHVRYSTTKRDVKRNAQPIIQNIFGNDISVAHNGNINPDSNLEKILENVSLQTTTDSEWIIPLIVNSNEIDFRDKVMDALSKLPPAYCFGIMYKDLLIGARDPEGYRPLSLGKLENSILISSETTAFNFLNAEILRDINPGEVVFIDKNGIESRKIKRKTEVKGKLHQCSFELDYFSRPDSRTFGFEVSGIKRKLGIQLAGEYSYRSLGLDIVIPMPDAGNEAWLGYYLKSVEDFKDGSGLDLGFGIIRHHYSRRTFIHPGQNAREIASLSKSLPNPHVINGKVVGIVDDSAVRFTTSKQITKELKERGAKKVHWLFTYPKWKKRCIYGIDTKGENELPASHMNHEELTEYVGADSLNFISIGGLRSVIPDLDKNFCYKCTGLQH